METGVVRTSGGRLVADLTQPMRHPLFKRLIPKILGQFDALAPEMLELATQRPGLLCPHGIKMKLGTLRVMLGLIGQIIAALGWRNVDGFATCATGKLNEGVHNDRIRNFFEIISARYTQD